MSNKNRVIGLEILRIVACFLVILRHVTDSYGSIIAKDNFRTISILRSISYTALPFFFLITGYFLFNYKDKGYKAFFSKKFNRVLIPYLFWGIIYILYLNMFTTMKIGYDIVKLFLTNSIYTHFWYVYYVIGVYICTPFLRKFVDKLSNKDLLYIISVWFVLCIINPILRNFNYGIPITFVFSDWWGYIIIGYAMRRVPFSKDIFKKVLAILASTVIVLTMINSSMFLTSALIKIPLISEMSITQLIITVSIFYISIYVNNFIQDRITDKAYILIVNISSLTYGIFLIHNLILYSFVIKMFGINITPTFIHPLLGSPVQALLIFMISLITVFLVSKIPLLKKVCI
ncbi:acyltransferase family protein [Clostridium sp. YIM B02505]|uniref:Acyltransferase family protein n=1 Tax=Clostridium yunnanense TaxID=2800325 RepID=A0ABS1EQ87_9CLOT|nr:acyltransferase family protein [Clostridium yunnanense]MBK1811526.1 acyltransferase family protein [Clostridium yunnanense]